MILDKTSASLLCLILLATFSFRDFGAPGEKNFFAFSASSIEGASTSFSAYAGKVVLVVNVASECGFTPQYEGLQKLYDRYKDKGFVILGFPSDDFGGQEPGSNPEIKKFCAVRFGVSFPLFAKSHVKGADKNSVYQYLTSGPDSVPAGEVAWNFEKFLISRAGKVIGRYKSATTPNDAALIRSVEKELLVR